jgi:alpha-1,3-rhamnosyl/mannosyltransferase
MASDRELSIAWVFDMNNCRGPTGVTRHALALLDRLFARPEVRLTVVSGRIAEPDGLASWEALEDRDRPPARRELPISTRNALRVWRVAGWPPLEPWTGRVDWVYCPAEYYVPSRHARRAVTSHDLLQDVRYGSNGRRELLGHAFRTADRILSVSRFNTEQLLGRYPECKGKVAIVPNAADDLFFGPSTDPERAAARVDVGLRPALPFLLSVANFQERKNLPRLVRAAGRLPEVASGELAIVLIGEGAESQAEPIRRAIAAIGPKAVVVMPGYRQGKTLRALYAEATALVFPSTCESFGIPAVEAMAQACPIALADSTALPEVAGEAGWYFDPEQDDALTSTLRDLLDRRDERDRRVDLGRAIASNYRWDLANEALMAVLRDDG